MPDKPPVSERHVKQLAKLERALHLRGWALALDALDLARELEAGKLRKDGKTPKFHHHVSVARLVYTLAPHLQFPERTVAAAFLHDLLEDHGDIIHADLDDRFGTTLANDVELLTKKTMGLAKTYEVYFEGMATSPVASVVKLADRAHNVHTMQGVFKPEKQVEYAEEIVQWFLPMLRQARRLHPRQYDAYENLKIMLRCQLSLIRAMHDHN